MTFKQKIDFAACAPGALAGGLHRMAFFDGMVLSEADLVREQTYWQTKRRLTNRALGHGVVWGLRLDWDAEARSFCLSPGYGLSCCGDDLVVECKTKVPERSLIDPDGPEFRALRAALKPDVCTEETGRVLKACVLLEYVECPEEPREIESVCRPVAEVPCRYGAVRETVRLRLVPPPPPEPDSHLSRFCRELRALAADHAVDGPVDDSGQRQSPDGSPEGGEIETRIDLEGTPQTGGTVSFRARNGYVLTGVTIDGRRPVFDPRMLFSVSLAQNDELVGTKVRVQLTLTPILPDRPALRLCYDVSRSEGESEVADTVTVTFVSRTTLETSLSCSAQIERAAFLTTDPECLWRGLALAGVAGWVTGLATDAGCDPRGGGRETEEEAEYAAQQRATLRQAAGQVLRLGYNALFDTDIARGSWQRLDAALRRVYSDFCAGFYYKGPQCTDHAHGIRLGCVDISPRGEILCFHPWAHRRTVLTGPLLSHWGKLIGLRPLDETIGALAEWLCCLAAHAKPLPFPGGAAAAPSIEEAEREEVAFAGEAVDMRSIEFYRNTGTVAVGDAEETRKKMNVAHEETLSAGALLVRAALGGIVAAPGRGFAPSDPVVAYRAENLGVRVYEPVAGGTSGATARGPSELDLGVERAAENATRIARQPVREATLAIADAIPLASLKIDENDAVLKKSVEALSGSGIDTVAKLVSDDPEKIAARIAPAMDGATDTEKRAAAERAVNNLYDAALAPVEAAGEALAEESAKAEADKPFNRATLKEDRVVSVVAPKIREHLKRNKMAAPEVKRILSVVADRTVG